MNEEDFTQLDKQIARYIETKTPREIADLAGVTPERVIARAEEMKDEQDAITLDTRIHFLMRRLDMIAQSALDDAQNAADAKEKGGLYSAAVGAIRESMKQLNLFKKENEAAIQELNMKRLRELLNLFDAVIVRGVEELVEEHGLDETEVTMIFQSKIVEAAKEIESR